ncbi:MAG: hypothetical protein WA190_10170 [Usitatibacter sp.]
MPVKIHLATDKCQRDVPGLGWTTDEVSDLISALANGHYKDSEWCAAGNGLVIDCDAYVVTIDPITGKPVPSGLYIKFGFRFPANNYVIVVSCHK